MPSKPEIVNPSPTPTPTVADKIIEKELAEKANVETPIQTPIQTPIKQVENVGTTQPPPTDDQMEQARNHYASVKNHVTSFAGKEGHNPAVHMIKHKFANLEERLASGERSWDLFKKVMALQKVDPVIDNMAYQRRLT